MEETAVDYKKYRGEVDARELKARAENYDKLCLSYTGEWGNNNEWNDGSAVMESGQVVDQGDLWYFLTKYKYLCKLSNIPDADGHCIVGWGASKLERCLELGCDWGHCFDVFERYFEEVYGIEAMESTAIPGAESGKNITLGVMESMPYEDDFFDVVLSNHVLEHSLSPEIVLAEVYRVTKPGGWSIHTLPCRVDKWLEPESLVHHSILDNEQWNVEFHKTGFKIVRAYFSWNHNQEEWNIIARKPE